MVLDPVNGPVPFGNLKGCIDLSCMSAEFALKYIICHGNDMAHLIHLPFFRVEPPMAFSTIFGYLQNTVHDIAEHRCAMYTLNRAMNLLFDHLPDSAASFTTFLHQSKLLHN